MKKKTTELFITLAILIHGYKYNYSKVLYINAKTKVCIVCPKHGEFYQTPDNHINLKLGCPKCANNIRKTTEDFVNKSNIKHNNKYLYSKVVYLNNLTPVIITCPIHGDFKLIPINHLKGLGCPECGRLITNDSKRKSLNYFINKANKIHNNFYDYSLINENHIKDFGIYSMVDIICPIHGKFSLKLALHLLSNGCPKCKRSKGELEIANFLKSKNINYIEQYKIIIDKQINSSGIAYIDFYLPDLNIFIEYNGRQHYVPVDLFGGKIQLTKLQLRDNFVRLYCNVNKINLIEIKYNESVTNILNNKL